MPRRFVLCLAFFCMGLNSCSKDRGRSPTEPEVSYTLAVTLWSGAGGNLGTGKYNYSAGTKVPYSFTAKSGHYNVAVQLGDTSTSPSGTIVMDGDKQVFVTAEPLIVLQPASEPIKADVEKFMGAPDTTSVVKAYQAYLTNLDALYASNPTQARSLALEAYKKAFEETPDSVREKAERALAGKLFGPQSTSASAGATTNTVPATVSLIYINGILNSIDDAAVARKEIEKIVAETGLTGTVEVFNFYNASARYDPKGSCVLRAAILGSLSRYDICGAPSDLGQLAKQVAEVLNKKNQSVDAETEALRNVITIERNKGRRVLLVGHSQGTVMAAQANWEQGPKDGCVAALSLGGILNKESWSPLVEPDLIGFVVAGSTAQDIVLTLGQNNFLKLSTNLAQDADARINSLLKAGNSLGAKVQSVFEDFNLHSMSGSYLAGDNSRDNLRGDIGYLATQLRNRDYCSLPSSTRIYATDAVISPVGIINAPSNLWAVDPRATGSDSLVAQIKDASGKPLLVIGLAQSPKTGELLGAVDDKLYSIGKSTGLATFVMNFTGVTHVMALAFDGQGDVYAGGQDGTVVGFYRDSHQIFWTGSFGSGFRPNALFIAPNGTLFGIANANGTGDNYVMRLSTPSHYGEFVGAIPKPIGFTNVFGAVYAGQTLFGLTAQVGASTGSLITLSLVDGVGTFVRKLAFDATGSSLIGRRR